MKIGILTFHCANNYGAVLQAYGLQVYLKSLGHEVFVIDYRPKYLIAPYKVFGNGIPSVNFFLKILYFCRKLMLAPKRLKRCWAFNTFRKEYLNICRLNWDSVDNDFDAFFLGSDQIWNPALTHGLDKVYLGNFKAAKNKKLIAYSASVGSIHNINSSDAEYMISQLGNFSAIGVREKSLCDLLSAFKLDVCTTIDPVLLAGRDIFDRIAADRIPQKNYLLLFQLDFDYKVESIAISIAKLKHLTVVKINSSSESIKNFKIKSSVSPALFLSYIKNAAYVVTSSFHGTVLSVLFEKDFTSVCLNKRNGERITNLLQQLGLTERIVMSENQMPFTETIDYKTIKKLQNILRNNSVEFVNKALNTRTE